MRSTSAPPRVRTWSDTAGLLVVAALIQPPAISTGSKCSTAPPPVKPVGVRPECDPTRRLVVAALDEERIAELLAFSLP